MRTFKRLLFIYTWPEYSWKLVKFLVSFLLKRFDTNRLIYTFVVFPIYQLISFVGIVLSSKLVSSLSLELNWWSGILAIPTLLFIAIPIFSTWHFSCLLIFKGYFDFIYLLTGLGFVKFTSNFCDSFIQMFRNGMSYTDIE